MGEYLIPAIAAVVVAIIEAIAANDRKRVKDAQVKAEKRAEIRAEESRLSMQMMDATLQLSIVTANALTGGHNNGNVERAKETAEKSMEEYYEFLRKVTAGQMSRI